MNWTEGNLARGRQRNQLLVRQKQHFAKVRNNLFNSGVKQSPITISFLDIGDTGQLQRQSRTSKASHGRYPSPSQHAQGNRQSKEKSQLKEHVHAPGAGHSNKQLLSETPLLTGKKKRQRGSQDTGENDADSRALHEKKRRLLGKADWVGLNMQQPLDIAFPGHHNRNDNSRWSKSVHRHTTKTSKLRHLIDAGRKDRIPNRDYCNPNPSIQHGQHAPLRIQIGSQEIQPGAASTPQGSRKRYSLVPRALNSSSTQLSSPVPSQARHLYAPQCSNKGRRIEHKKSSLPLSNSRPLGDKSQDLNVAPPPVITPIPGEGYLPQLVHSSSVIHEPVPRRAGRFRVLQWSPSKSETPESLQVHVGRPAHAMLPSQKADHETWKDFLASPDKGSESLTQASSHGASLIQLSVSPGVSALPSHLGVELPSLDAMLEQSSPKSASMAAGSHPVLESASFSRPTEKPLDDSRTSSYSAACSTSGEAKLNEEPARQENVNSPQQIPSVQGPRTRPLDKEEEEEEAWMKFVFDTDSDELQRRAFDEAAHRLAHELKPSDSSINTTDEIDFTGNDIRDFETVATCGTVPSVSEKQGSPAALSPRTSSESHMVTRGTIPSSSSNEPSIGTNNTSWVRSPNQRTTEQGFRFAAPKTFVGKHASSRDPMRTRVPLFQNAKTVRAKGRGRRKKTALDGRPIIREFPDFEDDSIEASDEG